MLNYKVNKPYWNNNIKHIKLKIFTEHDLVRGFAVHLLGFQVTVEQLDVSTAAIDMLFVFDGVLYDEVFALIAEWSELFGQRVEPSVLWRLYTLIGLNVVVESARAADELTELFAGMFWVRPLVFPRICKKVSNESNNYYKYGGCQRGGWISSVSRAVLRCQKPIIQYVGLTKQTINWKNRIRWKHEIAYRRRSSLRSIFLRWWPRRRRTGRAVRKALASTVLSSFGSVRDKQRQRV